MSPPKLCSFFSLPFGRNDSVVRCRLLCKKDGDNKGIIKAAYEIYHCKLLILLVDWYFNQTR